MVLCSPSPSASALPQHQTRSLPRNEDGLRRAPHGPRGRQRSRQASTPAHPPSMLCTERHANIRTTTSSALLTPLNLILASVLAYTLYASFIRTAPPPVLHRAPPPIVFKTYTPRTLLPLNGTHDTPVLLAVRGRVFDVSRGRNFYGPGGPYANFAGRDASRGLACGSFDEDMLTEDLDGPLDTLDGLGKDELEALRGWEERFLEKYDVIGKLVSQKEFDSSSNGTSGAGSD
ncbi:Damage response protein 1 [Tolypocladium ophioglossoides CBS 100239]|uniref:Damage response protein 1 n=1 Tax=Tolypocladium ophioglossoides (strain CBS 100239) TaxID=1163406 RepID=A0A0L0N0K7_TOLOC|nr:Damage response protein 1 [Tolypocladium ophioglossoides CBS 100239]